MGVIVSLILLPFKILWMLLDIPAKILTAIVKAPFTRSVPRGRPRGRGELRCVKCGQRFTDESTMAMENCPKGGRHDSRGIGTQ